jgi:hypothetical protein
MRVGDLIAPLVSQVWKVLRLLNCSEAAVIWGGTGQNITIILG